MKSYMITTLKYVYVIHYKTMDSFSVSKHCDVFFCGRSLAGGRKSPLTASLTLAVKFVRVFF